MGITLGGAVLCASFLLAGRSKNTVQSNLFIQAETEPPASLDPLEADYINNLHASQMVHRSILEITQDNTLTSSVLSSFTYNPDLAQIVFTTDDSQVFSDGTPITADDVSFAVKRMLMKRPTFPVIRHIKGRSRWLKSPDPLNCTLEGITSTPGRVVIQLDRHVQNPLYRFALPIFGIVKKDGVDPKTNRWSDGSATSGFYRLVERTDHTWAYELLEIHRERALVNRISLSYLPGPLRQADLEPLSGSNVVASVQSHGTVPEQEQSYSRIGLHRIDQPSTRFSLMLLNPGHPAFGERECRWLFAERFRAELDPMDGAFQFDASLFSRIVPGYVSASELRRGIELTPEQERKCRHHLRGSKVRWMPTVGSDDDLLRTALTKVARAFDFDLVELAREPRNVHFEMFASGELDLSFGGSSFWPFDPVGDVQMLFTPNLHKPLQFVSDERELQKLLSGLEFEANPSERMGRINRFLFTNALFNVYAHSRYSYLVRGQDVSRTIPIAITPPAPWQVFDAEKR